MVDAAGCAASEAGVKEGAICFLEGVGSCYGSDSACSVLWEQRGAAVEGGEIVLAGGDVVAYELFAEWFSEVLDDCRVGGEDDALLVGGVGQVGSAVDSERGAVAGEEAEHGDVHSID